MSVNVVNRISRTETIEELETRIQGQLGNRVLDLRLEYQDGGLVLHGYANTYHAKQLAQHAVLEATDVSLVANDIEVK